MPSRGANERPAASLLALSGCRTRRKPRCSIARRRVEAQPGVEPGCESLGRAPRVTIPPPGRSPAYRTIGGVWPWAPELAVGDGALGFWKALDEVWPGARHQRCWVHKTANVLNKAPKSVQTSMKADLREIHHAPSRAAADAAIEVFAQKYGAPSTPRRSNA